MQSIENRDVTIGDPIEMNEQVVDGIRGVLGDKVVFHHTIRRNDTKSHDGKGMTYGGLYKDRENAEVALQKVKDGNSGILGVTAYNAQNAEVIYLAEEDKYAPWGGPMNIHTHGEDDGTHGSQVKGNVQPATLGMIREH